MANEFLRARSPKGNVGVAGVVDSGELSAYSLGTLSGFEGDSVAGWTISVGGESGVQDATIARNPAGESELIVGTSGQTTDFLLSGAPGTPGQSRTDALVVYKDITLVSEVNDGIDTVDYLVVEGTPASTGSQEPPSMSTVRSVVPNGAQAFIGIVGYVTVSYGQSDLSLGNYRVNSAQVSSMGLANILEAIYPVGAVYVSGSSTMPPMISAIGTWERLNGRVIVGVNESQTEFNTVDKTGGARTHTLTTAQIPAHSHSIRSEWGTNSNITISTPGQYNQLSTTGAFRTNYGQQTGGGGAHNNLQPYKTKYMWERTA